MGSPTLIANPFHLSTSNYLLSPKPGQKRTFPTFGKEQFKPHTISYQDLHSFGLPNHSEETFATRPYSYLDMSKYQSRIPFQVPPLKKPAIVGGFLGAKSQSLREESGKMLWDIFMSSICMNNIPTEKGICNSPPVISTGSDYFGFAPKDISMTENYMKKSMPSDLGMPRTGNHMNYITTPATNVTHSQTLSEEHSKMKMCVQDLCSDTLTLKEGKPPTKKPKLKLPCNRQSQKAKRKSKRKCRRNVQSDPVIQSPGYNPTQTAFESVDEIDCGIALSNRFSPLENECILPSVSESPGDSNFSDFPLLNKLSDMRLDDFEVEFDNSVTEFCDIRSYEPSDSLDYNSSIAFILSGNDDIASDSEDGSFASDLDDVHWQSFKANFELFQENIPLQNIILGSCGVTELVFEADLEEMGSDDIFLNDLHNQHQSAIEKLEEVNLRWNRLDCGNGQKLNSSKVCFAPEDHLASVHYIPSGPEERHARKSPWEQCYLDRCRFQKRIQEIEPVISMCLAPQHRKSVFQRLYGSGHPAPY